MNLKIFSLIMILGVFVSACIPASNKSTSTNTSVNNNLPDQAQDSPRGEDLSQEEGSSDQIDSTLNDDEIKGDDQAMMKDDINNAESQQEDAQTPKTSSVSFSGEVLAGSVTPLINFNQSDYDKALAANKTVILYFYASWCPTCRVEFPKMQSAFDKASNNNVVGFRVNYNDSDTDANEEALAREFGIVYQHTKVVINNGERVLKDLQSWEETRYTSEINKY